MSRQLSSLLKVSVAGIALLIVGGCKPADKGQGALKSAGIDALNLSKADASTFGKYFETPDCTADEMESLGALAGLGLGEDGVNGLSYGARDVSANSVTYTDMKAMHEGNKSFTAKSVVFYCPHMSDDGPVFNRLDLQDGKIVEDDVSLSFSSINVAKPTHAGAVSLVQGIAGADINNDGIVGFGAISVKDVVLEAEEAKGSISTLVWGETRDEDQTGTADVVIDDVDFVVTSKAGVQDLVLAFDGMSAKNMNLAASIDPSDIADPSQTLSHVIGNLNTFKKPYDELLMGNLTVDTQAFELDFKGIEGKTVEKGDVITTQQTLNPFEFKIKPAMEKMPEFNKVYGILKSLGFETITLSGSSVTTLDKAKDSISVSDGVLEMDDAFRLNFEYAAEGVAKMQEKVLAQTAAGKNTKDPSLYNDIKLQSLRLTLEDNSIVDRGLTLASEMTGQNRKTIKRGLGMAVFAAALAAENEVQAEVFSESTEAFANFVKNGGTLTIEANPPAPFPLSPLVAGGGEDIDPATLGFSASQEDPTP